MQPRPAGAGAALCWSPEASRSLIWPRPVPDSVFKCRDPDLSHCPGHSPLLTESSPSSAFPLALPGAMWTPWAPGPGEEGERLPTQRAAGQGQAPLWSSEALAAGFPRRGAATAAASPRGVRQTLGGPSRRGAAPAPPSWVKVISNFQKVLARQCPAPLTGGSQAPRLQMKFGSRFPIFKNTLQAPPSAQGVGGGGPRETHPLHLPLPTATLIRSKQAEFPFPPAEQ